MLKIIAISSALIVFLGCASSSPKNQDPLPTQAKESASAPVPLSQNLVEIRSSISKLESETFGDEKLKSIGLAGELKICRIHLASKAAGGSGELLWDEPTEKLSEEWLNKEGLSLETYQAVFLIAQYRRDYFKRELDQCSQVRSTKPPSDGGVEVVEGDSDNDERVHSFVCNFVAPNASLREFLVQAFSRGTLKLEDFDLDQSFLVAKLKDEKQKEKPNGLMFMGWKLSFNNGPLLLKDILLQNKDALLEAWTFSGDVATVKNSKICLKRGPAVWNY